MKQLAYSRNDKYDLVWPGRVGKMRDVAGKVSRARSWRV